MPTMVSRVAVSCRSASFASAILQPKASARSSGSRRMEPVYIRVMRADTGYAGGMRAGAAVSRAEDVRLAARDAATRALDSAGLDEAACLIVAATPEHLDEAVELCEALRDAAGPNVQIVGGAT